MTRIFRVLGPIMIVANALGLGFWIYTRHLKPVGPNGLALDGYDAISFEITILAVLVGAVALGLGVAALIGYATFKDMVTEKARQVVQEYLSTLKPEDLRRAVPNTAPTTNAVTEDVTREGGDL